MQLTSPQPSQTQWLARPQPPAVTGGPRRNAVQSKQPHFGGWIPANAMQQFVVDTMGVWVPKAPVALTRSKLQFFEDTFLEFVEDAAFYFTIPIVGNILGMGVNRIYNGVKGNYKDIGTSWTELATREGTLKKGVKTLANASPMDTLPRAVKQNLIATKSGVVLGAVVSALAFEFMIQHAKNVITATKFKTSNFTGVAGLEDSRTDIRDGEDDPVAKAKKRALQAGGIVGGALLSALVLPKLINKFNWHHAAGKVLKYFNFASGTTGAFDTQKSFQFLLTFVGLGGYLDASRDRLEWKEQLTRLGVVIPYLLFGQQLASNGLAKLFERLPVSGKSIRDWGVRFTKGSALEKAMNPESFLNLNVTRDLDAIEKTIQKSKLPTEVAKKIKNVHKYGIGWGSYILGATVCGVGINLISYAITRERYRVQQQKKQQRQQQAQQQAQLQGLMNYSAFSGNRPVQQGPSFGFPPYYPQGAPTQSAYGQPQWVFQGASKVRRQPSASGWNG